MINKNKFSIKNTKKVLHKVGKQWVVVSAVLLGLVAGGAAVNETANAQTTQPQQSVKVSPADKAKGHKAIDFVKANKSNVVNDAVKVVNNDIRPGSTTARNTASAGYSNVASLAHVNSSNGSYTGALANLSNGVPLGTTSDSTNNTWMGVFNQASNAASEINDNNSNPKTKADVNYYLGKVNKLLNNNKIINSKDKSFTYSNIPFSYPTSAVLPKQYQNNSDVAQITSAIDNEISNNVSSKETSALAGQSFYGFDPLSLISINPDIYGDANVSGSISIGDPNETPADVINNHGVTVHINVNGRINNIHASLTASEASNAVNNVRATIVSQVNSISAKYGKNIAEYNNLKANPNGNTTIDKTISGQRIDSSVSNSELLSELELHHQNISKAANDFNYAESLLQGSNLAQTMTNKVNTLQRTLNGYASDILTKFNGSSFSKSSSKAINLNDKYSTNDISNLLDGNDTSVTSDSNMVHSAIASLATSALGNSAKASTDLDKAADAIIAANQMLNSGNMVYNYDGLVDELSALPNGNNSAEANDLFTAASDANNLASEYSSANTNYNISADKTSVVSYLTDAANQAYAAAKSLDAPMNIKPSANVNPEPKPASVPSNNTDNGNNYNPFVFPSSFANSANVMPSSTSTVVPASSESKKHAANYAKVIKALQLHTSPNFTKRNGVKVVKPGSAFWIEKSVKANNGALRYEVRYNNKNYFITANKHMVNAYYKAAKHVNYRYTKVTKALQLHTSAKFTKRNGVKVVKPGTELRIDNVVKDHGLTRYEVRYQGHNYFITANSHFTVNAYLQKSDFSKRGYKAVRAIKSVNSYRHATFSKRGLVRHFRRGTVLPVRRVLTIGNGEVTRLQLTNGRYVSANKDFVEPIR